MSETCFQCGGHGGRGVCPHCGDWHADDLSCCPKPSEQALVASKGCSQDWCCDACKGTGWDAQEPCGDCYGTGHTHVLGDAAEVASESGGTL